jgi:hypothetical protein
MIPVYIGAPLLVLLIVDGCWLLNSLFRRKTVSGTDDE